MKKAKRKQQQSKAVVVQAKAQAASAARASAQVRKQLDYAASMATREGMTYAKMMALPESMPAPVRLPTNDMPVVALTRTSKAFAFSPMTIAPVQQPVSDTGDCVFFVYGQPGRMMQYGPLTYTTTVEATTSTFSFAGSAGGTEQQSYVNFNVSGSTLYGGSSETVFMQPVRHVNASGNVNTMRPLGRSNGRTYFWLNAGEQFYWKCNNSPVGGFGLLPGDLSITVYKWIGVDDTDSMKTYRYPKGFLRNPAFTYSDAPMELSGLGWYSIEFTISMLDADSTTNLVALTTSTISPGVNFQYMAFAWDETIVGTSGSGEIGENCRRTATSVLITNTSPVLNKGGSVTAARLVNERISTPNALVNDSSLNVTTLNNASQKYTGMAEKGVYTYMDFEQSSELFAQAVNQYGSPCFNLDVRQYVNAIRITSPSTVNSFLITIQAVIEFKTDSMLYSKSVPDGYFNALVEARRINNSTDYFYENPLHLGDIWRYIVKGFNAARKVAVPLGMAASTTFPEASGLIMPIAHALQT